MFAIALETKLLLAYVGVLFLACFLGGMSTVVLENNHVNDHSDYVSYTMTESLKTGLNLRMESLLQIASTILKQLDGDVTYQHDYAVMIFNDSLPYVSFNKNYNVMDYPSIIPPNLNADGSGPHASFYYRKNTTSTSFLNKTSLLDDSHGPVVRANPAYAGLYIGLEDGLLRHVPYLSGVGPSLNDNSYCLSEDIIGYYPSCRSWYIKAKAVQIGTQYTSPYKDANTGAVMISLAQAVVVMDQFIGVVAADVTLASLEIVVKAATILDSGYTYICDEEKQLIVHPNITDPNILYSVADLEFASDADTEIAAFNTFLNTAVFEGEVGQNSFIKGGSLWFVTYGPIAGTPYFLLMVVPESEVIEPATEVESYGHKSLLYLVIAAACIGSFVLVAGSFIARWISKLITEPVILFTKILSDIATHNMEDNTDGGGGGATAGELTEIHSLRNKISDLILAVKFSTDAYYKSDYESALDFLQHVEDMFTLMGQRRALGVIYNNRGNILRKHVGDRDNFATALSYLEMGVSIIREEHTSAVDELAKAKEAALQAFRGNSYRVVSSADIRVLSDTVVVFEKILGLRLSNYGDCLREAQRYADAETALSESFSLFLKCDDVLGMLQVKGNQGLLKMDQGNAVGAEEDFTNSIKLAKTKFERDVNYATAAGVQFASMNIGSFHYKSASKFAVGSAERAHQVEMALSSFYYALSVCDRVHRAVQSQCLFTLAEIYKHEYGAGGALAVESLCKMYPQFAKEIASVGGVTKVNFLIDVSSSMIGPRIEATSRALHDIVNTKMKFGDKLCMDSFSKNLTSVVNPVTLDADVMDRVNKSIEGLTSSCVPGVVDGTSCFKALLEVGTKLITSNPTGPHVVVVLTDGLDNQHGTSAAEVKGFFVEHDIKLIVVSVGSDDAGAVDAMRYLATSKDLFVKANTDPRSIAHALQLGFDLAVSDGNVVMEAL